MSLETDLIVHSINDIHRIVERFDYLRFAVSDKNKELTVKTLNDLKSLGEEMEKLYRAHLNDHRIKNS